MRGGREIRRERAEGLQLTAGLTGSVVGIQFEVGGMYTGTIITDLMAAVDRAERRAVQARIAEDQELREIFSMQIPIFEDGLLLGAA